MVNGHIFTYSIVFANIICMNKKKIRGNRYKHGMSNTLTYKSWQTMHNRCRNPNAIQYKFYGGRGIKVCKRWYKFENFLRDVGLRKNQGYTLDRINNNKNYYPSNCKWATKIEQANNKRSNHNLTYLGKTKNATQWGKELGLKPKTILQRIYKGYNTEQALSTKMKIWKIHRV